MALPTLFEASLNKAPHPRLPPLLVTLVFRAPVPAYIRDNASPLSAQSSRCAAATMLVEMEDVGVLIWEMNDVAVTALMTSST